MISEFAWWRWGRRRRPSRLRWCVGAGLTLWLAARPIQLSSTEWWRSPRLTSSISLTPFQRRAIEQIYQARLAEKRQRVERLIEATNRLHELLQEGADQDQILKGTQSVARAADAEWTFARSLNQELVAILSTEQQKELSAMIGGSAR